MTNKILNTVFALFFILTALYPAGYHLVSIKSNPHSLYLKIKIDPPKLRVGKNGVYASYEQARYLAGPDALYLPYFSKLFNLADSKISPPHILTIKTQTRRVNNYLSIPNVNPDLPPLHQVVEANYLGLFRDAPLFDLNIFPARYNKRTRQLTFVTELELEIKTVYAAKGFVSSLKKNYVSSATLNSAGMYKQEPSAGILSAKQRQAFPANPALYLQNRFKIGVKEEGIYKITYSDLLEAGFPVGRINPRKIRLFNKGREIPVYFQGQVDGAFDEGDYFEFWGEPNEKTFLDKYPDEYKDPFSDINIYWLVTDDSPKEGLRLPEESAGLSSLKGKYVFTPYAFTETIHYEQDNHHENFGHWSAKGSRPSYELDNWYYDAGISAPEGVAYDFVVPHPFESGADVVIKAAFRGKSFYKYGVNPLQGHQVQLKLRGKGDVSKLIGQVLPSDGWRDQNMRFISNADSASKLPQAVLVDGVNRLEVDMFQTGVTDMVLLNWFDLTYLRKYKAYHNFLKFKVDEAFFNNAYVHLGDTIQVNIDGFSNKHISVYKLGISKMVNGTIGPVLDGRQSSFGVSIQDQIFDPKVEYVACTEDAKKKPLFIRPQKDWKSANPAFSIVDNSNDIDYLIITSDLLYKNALQLKEVKEQDGFHADVIPVEVIYDWFNYGIKSPLAIKNFLRYALENWNSAHRLKYVVFVGKGSYDHKNRMKKNSDPVPTFMYQTEKFGSASADYWYALLSGDDYIPDITVGRIPAETNQELLNYIDKIKNYESGTEHSAWRNTALFISGNDAGAADLEDVTYKPIFRAQNLRLINQRLPQSMFARRLNTTQDEHISGYDPNFGSTTDLLEYFDKGLAYINYLGHGGGHIWADVNLLNLTDVDRMNNGYKLPFISSMTCFTGAFENPGQKSLGEKLIIAQQKGAIAMLASSGVGWKSNDFAIEWNLFDFLWNRSLSFGEAVNLMKITYLANPIYYTDTSEMRTKGFSALYRSMVCQYNFLGDPSLKIQQPDGRLSVSASDATPVAGDTVSITVSGISDAGNGHLEITNENNDRMLSRDFAYNGQSATILFPVLQDSTAEEYAVKAYIETARGDAAGYTEIAVKKPVVRWVKITPHHPQVGQPLSFEVGLRSYADITSMALIDFRDYNRTASNAYSGVVKMNAVNDTLFRSQNSFNGFPSGGLKYFDISILNALGKVTIVKRQRIEVNDPRPDLYVDRNSIRYSGDDQLKLAFDIINDSDTDLNDVKAACYDSAGVADGQPFATPVFSLKKGQRKTLEMDYPSLIYTAQRRFKVVVDPDNHIAERNETNNSADKVLTTDHIYVDKALGTSLNGSANQPLTISGHWNFYIAQNQLSRSQVIGLKEQRIADELKNGAQSGLRFIAFGRQADTTALRITFNSAGKGRLSVAFDSSTASAADMNGLSFYRFDEFLNLWVKTSSNINGRRVETDVTQNGLYGVFYSNDAKKPSIEVSANGRPLITDMLVVHNPSLAILLQDENGVNYTHTLSVTLDDNALIEEGVPSQTQEVSIPDSIKNASAVSIAANPNLSAGKHKLTVSVADVNGNVSSKEYNFLVTEGFDIIVYGNYPNPFSDQTIISFYVNSDNEIDNLNIKIFTTSGRLIRKTMLDLDESVADDNIRMPFNHELIWDGRDDNGNSVANGVYFLVIKGTYKGKTVSHTLKIARLQ